MYGKIKETIKNMKLSGKMMAMYLVVTGITCLTALATFQASLKIYDRELYEKAQQELDYFAQRVNDELDEIEALSLSIVTDREIQEKLSLMADIPYLSSEYYFELQELRSLLLNEMNACDTVKSLIYTDGQDVTFTVGMDCGEIKASVWEDMLARFEDARGGYDFCSPTEEYPYLLSGRNILERKNASLDYMGSLFLVSDISGLLEEKADELTAEHSRLFVYSPDGFIYQEGGEGELPMPSFEEESGYRIIRHQGEKVFLCYEKSLPSEWMYVNFFPYSEIFGSITAARLLVCGGFIGALLLSLLIMKKISGVVTRPLEKLSESMKIVENGDFQAAKRVIPPDCGRDEVGVLAEEFQVMLDKIEYLIHENYEKQILLQDTRYKMLQSQINPHFLYNTLNMINWMACSENGKEVSKIIVELSKLLRASFAKDSYTSVAEEVKIAKSYITIQKNRYQSRAVFVVEEEGNLEDYIIPRMILQPLIENSVNYGVEKTMDSCRITVKAKEEKNYITLEVEDQGIGMTEEELKAVRDGTVTPKGHGIGLKNIRERLKITYPDHELRIDSEAGKGTRIFIRVPKVKRGEEGLLPNEGAGNGSREKESG